MKRFGAAVLSIIMSFMMAAAVLPETAAAEEEAYRYGTVTLYSTYAPGETLTDGFYYTDSWFFEDPAVRNDSLALVSIQLTAAAADGEGGCGTDFLNDLGFEESGCYGFETDDPDGAGYTWGKKEISSDGESFTLIAVAMQSYSLDIAAKKRAWTQNFRVNGDTPSDKHYAYELAVDSIIDSVAALPDTGNVKFWITGQSRGGALADLLAAELPEKLPAAEGGIYTYTFEAPAVINADAEGIDGDYGYIHNYICSDDFVAMMPPWGMIRYGTDHILNSSETDEKLPEELHRLGSSAYSELEGYSGEWSENMGAALVDTLTSAMPSRDDYSAVHTDVFTGDDGNEISVSYIYQEIFIKLMGIIFGDGMEFSTSDISADLTALIPAIKALARGVSGNSDSDYYLAAKELGSFLEKAGISLPLSDEDVYALLKLAGPQMIDLSAAPDPDSVPDMMCISYITPLITFVSEVQGFRFSHNFDTLVARLKALAPAPEIGSIDIAIPVPAAGDAVSLAPSAAEEYIRSLGNDWMNIEAAWAGIGDTVPDNSVCYLDITLSAAGANVPEDFALTLNGADPEAPVSVVYENGVNKISGTWAFTFGEPETYTVSFDAGEQTSSPSSVTVEAGRQLKYAVSPIMYGSVYTQQGSWQFNGWFDEDGQPWDTLFAKGDITLYAKWIRLIASAEVTVPIPHAGEAFTDPSVPEDCGYHIEEVNFYTEDYLDAEKADEGAVYLVSLRLRCDSDDIRFVQFTDEDDVCTYLGRLYINDEEQEFNTYKDLAAAVYCDEGGAYMDITYYFEPLPAE